MNNILAKVYTDHMDKAVLTAKTVPQIESTKFCRKINKIYKIEKLGNNVRSVVIYNIQDKEVILLIENVFFSHNILGLLFATLQLISTPLYLSTNPNPHFLLLSLLRNQIRK